MKIVTLQTKEQLNIFMNPQRQTLLRVLAKSSSPRTPKDLSLELNVSPSSIQHHLKKLESLGLVYVDHTAEIHGITAKYYAPAKVTVRIGCKGKDPLFNERETLLRSLVADVLDDTLTGLSDQEPETCARDVMTGVVHLTPQRAVELQRVIRDFLLENDTASACTEPWEYALIYHRWGNKQ